MGYDISAWLPTSAKEVISLGWKQPDVIIFSGDAYVDHPSFPAAVVGRVLQSCGLKVAIVPQPNWRDDLRDFRKLGAPRLFFGVSGGAMDSMVNHYTANKRLRSDDAYTPGGQAGMRPDYAVTTYTRILKSIYPNVPVLAGGIEASLRRLCHYDYWSDSIMPSILAGSGADFVLYGLGDKVLREVAAACGGGYNAKKIKRLRQVAYLGTQKDVEALGEDKIMLHPFERCLADKRAFGENFTVMETTSNRLTQDKALVEPTGEVFVIVNPAHGQFTGINADFVFDLPYTRLPHPRYAKKGEIPAYGMIKNSVNIHRGCFGGCSFCTISAHQGKFISSRSEKSILAEIDKVRQMPGFAGYISDIGGPSANMYGMGGRDRNKCERCARPSCIWPRVCPNLDNDHSRLRKLYASVREVPGIKKAFVSSGIRYDMFRPGDGYFEDVVKYHTSGRLKVAPEHTEDHVLRMMRKPPFEMYEKLHARFQQVCREQGLKYQLVPYFISSHPGCSEQDMKQLSLRTRRLGLRLEQVQDLTPTPMTLSSVMFYTGIDPYSGKKVFVARHQDEKRRQKSYFFGKSPAGGRGKIRGR